MRKMFAIGVVLMLATVASAGVQTMVQSGVTITTTDVPSVSNPALTVHTVNYATLNGDKIVGWDGTITGNLSQSKPMGFLASIFSDMNPAFAPPYYLDQDSQYLYLTNAMDPVGGALVGGQSEDAASLFAGFALVGGAASGQAAAAHNLAQVVMPVGQSGWALGLLLLETPGGVQYTAAMNHPIPVPEPATMALLGLGGLVAIRRRR